MKNKVRSRGRQQRFTAYMWLSLEPCKAHIRSVCLIITKRYVIRPVSLEQWSGLRRFFSRMPLISQIFFTLPTATISQEPRKAQIREIGEICERIKMNRRNRSICCLSLIEVTQENQGFQVRIFSNVSGRRKRLARGSSRLLSMPGGHRHRLRRILLLGQGRG